MLWRGLGLGCSAQGLHILTAARAICHGLIVSMRRDVWTRMLGPVHVEHACSPGHALPCSCLHALLMCLMRPASQSKSSALVCIRHVAVCLHACMSLIVDVYFARLHEEVHVCTLIVLPAVPSVSMCLRVYVPADPEVIVAVVNKRLRPVFPLDTPPG